MYLPSRSQQYRLMAVVKMRDIGGKDFVSVYDDKVKSIEPMLKNVSSEATSWSLGDKESEFMLYYTTCDVDALTFNAMEC